MSKFINVLHRRREIIISTYAVENLRVELIKAGGKTEYEKCDFFNVEKGPGSFNVCSRNLR